MRRSDQDDDTYAANQWSSYTTNQQGLPLSSPHIRSSGSAVSGYHNPAGNGHGMWVSHSSSNTNSYPRHDQGLYAQHNQTTGYHSCTSQRVPEPWSDPSGAYGRHSIELPHNGTSTSQTHWDHHGHNRSTSYGVSSYDPSSNYATHFTASASSSHQASSPTGETHNYIALPSTPQSTIESYLAPVKLEDTDPMHKSKRAYRCTWVGCTKAARGELFKSKDNARVHVHKHFGSDKLFECVVGNCRKTFASEDAAKRHRDTTESKAFSCANCAKVFARKDYRDVHQRKCAV